MVTVRCAGLALLLGAGCQATLGGRAPADGRVDGPPPASAADAGGAVADGARAPDRAAADRGSGGDRAAAPPDALAADGPPAPLPEVVAYEDPASPRSVTCNGVALPPDAAAYGGCAAHDLQWATALYGFQLQRASAAQVAQAGGAVYRLVQVIESNGPVAFKTFVVDAQGAPLQHAVTYCWWVDADAAGALVCAAGGETVTVRAGADGAADLVVGGAAYVACGAHGPYGVQVSEPGAASDRVIGLGWLLGTNHLHLNLVFQRIEPGQVPAPVARCPW